MISWPSTLIIEAVEISIYMIGFSPSVLGKMSPEEIIRICKEADDVNNESLFR